MVGVGDGGMARDEIVLGVQGKAVTKAIFGWAMKGNPDLYCNHNNALVIFVWAAVRARALLQLSLCVW